MTEDLRIEAPQGILCPACGRQNTPGAGFCAICGTELAPTCARCGAGLSLDPQARFCSRCGAQAGVATDQAAAVPDAVAERLRRLLPREFAERLLASRGQVTGERRMVTILKSDVSGSSRMARGMDPEEVVEIMDGAFDALIRPIARYEGTVARLEGDAILAFFGAPIAHEDDPERACRAALEIVDGARAYAERLERERGIRGFDVRVGVNTGLVVVGEVGSDLRVEYTAMGDAVNLAARLEGAARAGPILISEATHRLVAPLFETEPLEPIEVKGWDRPMPVYRLLAAKDPSGKIRGVSGLESPLVGRERELAALQEVLEGLISGRGGLVTLVGDAGIGKSRLVAELRERASGNLTWMEGRCLSYGGSIPYLPWLEVLHSALGMKTEGPPEAMPKALAGSVRRLCAEREDAVYPYLARLMSIPLGERAENELDQLDGQQLRELTFSAIRTVLRRSVLDRPLVIVLEDLHWADATSLALLEHVLPLAERLPLLLVAVFRPHKEHGSWRLRTTAVEHVADRHLDLLLHPLTASDSASLVANLLREGGLPDRLRQRILARAEGNPFYVEEVIRSLIDDGSIGRDEATGRWAANRELSDIPIPETLHGVLTARIDRLQEDARKVLQIASVIGRIFRYPVLAAIAGTETVAREASGLDRALIELQREEMIREHSPLPEMEYIFKHELTRDAAYGGMLKKDRRSFHRRVAEALEDLYPERAEEQVELLAHHWEHAGDVDRAIRYLTRAGDRARRVGASLEAVAFYELALSKAPDGAAGLHRIHERLGDLYLINLSRHAEALEHYQALFGLAESDEDWARGARKVAGVHMLSGDLDAAKELLESALSRLARGPVSAEASRVHFALSSLFFLRNQLAEAERHASASLGVSHQVADVRGLADANKALAVIAVNRGDMEAAIQHDQESLELYRELGDLPRTALAYNNLGDSLRLMGQTSRAMEFLGEGLEIARRIGDTREETVILTSLAEVSIDRGDWERAVDYLERALPLAEESGVVHNLTDVHWLLGSAYEGLGRLDDAGKHLSMAESLCLDTERLQLMPQIYLDQARVRVSRGTFDEAERLIELALEAAGPEPSSVFLGVASRCFGYLDRQRGRLDRAVSHLEESLERLEGTKLPVEIAKTRQSLGTACATRDAEGDRGRACEHLLAARSTFERSQASGRLAQVDVWLEKLECGPYRTNV